jgi:hypothetical protein
MKLCCKKNVLFHDKASRHSFKVRNLFILLCSCYNTQLRMMRKTYSFVLAALVMGLFFVGCKEKPVTTPGDLENPKIVMTSPIELPVGQYIPISSSDSFFVDISFTDDKELRDWEITIRFMPELNYLRTNVQPWKETWFGDLDGKTGAVNFKEFVSFDPTAGPYEFIVKVTDMEGKTAERRSYYFVRNRVDIVPPTVTITMPNPSSVDTVAIGNQLRIVANCNEQFDALVDIYLRVRDDLTNNLLENSEIRWDTLFLANYNIDTFITVPAGAVPGNYNVEIYANDGTYNVGYGKSEFYIKPN